MAQPQSEQPHSPLDPSALLSGTARLPDHARVVAVGASAGGLHALGLILAALPPSFPAPVLVVQHLSPDFPSQLPRLLGRHTPLHVKQAEQGDRLRAGWVYVAPPGKHLLACADGSLALTLTHKVHHCRPSADVLLTSVATSFGVRAVGVILTGGDGDGAAGIQAVKAAGGVTIAQDLSSSQQPSMPRNAAATGDVDFVLSLADIAAALVALTGPEDTPQPGRGTGFDSGDADKEGHADRTVGTALRVPEPRYARRTGVVELLTRRETAAKAVPISPDALAKAAADLAACTEALGVAKEALRVQSDVITSYRLSLEAEATGSPTR